MQNIKDAIAIIQAAQTITAAQAAATEAAKSTTKIAHLPSDFKQHDLEKFMPTRRRARGDMSTTDLASFAAYIESYADLGSTVFIDAPHMKAVAVLNLGDTKMPGHADNKAHFHCKQTAAYESLNEMTDSQKTQTAIAEWLEDWAPNIQCFHENEKVNPIHAVAAFRSITIESARKVESESRQLGATLSALESVQAGSKHMLPTHIYFNAKPYAELAERIFVMRVSIITSEKPQIILRISQEEIHKEEMAQELQKLIKNSITSTKVQVLVGTYQAT